MKKAAIFSDVDGTIYPFPGKNLSQVNIDKTKEINKKNVFFVINTGNGPYEKIQRLADSLCSRYIVCSNGALIFDNQEKKILNIEYISKLEAQKIWDIADTVDIGLYYFGTHQYYLRNADQKQIDFMTDFCEYNNWIFDGRIPEDLHKIEAYGPREKLEKFYNLTKEKNVDLNVVLLDKHIEITKNGVSKGTGMKWLCENIFDIPLSEVMAIGDSQNDISMFELAGFPYAMENTDPYTRTFAKYFTSTVEQDGLAMAIDDYLYRIDFDLKKEISQGKKHK
ncbi:Cof-type HAD-IIB family hydrolase [Mycoplasma leonicaptivi]|uniref:Cof-type HAD-IIB family hydrolase n=1 Tax=Mycoplasma leonicaptivi TaxID=36742 RepID=UPI000480ADD8|nr:Cof-type HAD-IIB family hydrolase [Mycoplasma leonicaptivi]